MSSRFIYIATNYKISCYLLLDSIDDTHEFSTFSLSVHPSLDPLVVPWLGNWEGCCNEHEVQTLPQHSDCCPWKIFILHLCSTSHFIFGNFFWYKEQVPSLSPQKHTTSFAPKIWSICKVEDSYLKISMKRCNVIKQNEAWC